VDIAAALVYLFSMIEGERGKLKAWVDNWKTTGEELDRLKWEELRAMDEQESARIFNALASGWVDEWTPSDRECGLVVQQAIFSRSNESQCRS
jgi:hypothetical protein